MSVSRQAVACLLLAVPAVAQSPAFEAVTIESNGSGPVSMSMKVLSTGDLIASSVPVIVLLRYAYDVPINPSPRLSGLPDWAFHERYHIEAKARASAVPPGLPGSQERGRTQQMIRELLADRFKLVMRIDHRTMSVYALRVSSGGPKLQKSAITEKECIFDTNPEGCHNFISGFGHPLHAKAIDMDDLANYLGNWTDRPVVNRTEVSGLFAVNTEGWKPMRLPPPPPNATPAVLASTEQALSALPTIVTVLGKLGLELKQQEDTLLVYTVEHIERPAAN